MLVSCKGLAFAYDERPVLDEITFELGPGCIGLLGANGAGKTTLIRCLLGLVPIGAGQAEVLGHDPATNSLELRQKVGYMPERPSLIGGLNAFETVVVCARLCGLADGAARSRAHQVLGFVGIGEQRYRPAEEYSTGMLQRLMLACALVHGPRLVILDEPTVGLDPFARQQVLELVAQISSGGEASVILSTHLLRDVERVCDQLLVLDGGRVAYAGGAREFSERRTGVLELKVKHSAQKLASALGRKGLEVAVLGDGRLVVEGTEPSVIWSTASEVGVQIRRLSPPSMGLEHSLEGLFPTAGGKAGPA